MFITVGHSEGIQPDLNGKKTFAPYSGFIPDTPVLTHYYLCQAEVHPRGNVKTNYDKIIWI